MKPVLYLDVDDTILMFPPWRDKAWWDANKGGAPAPKTKEFLEWAAEHCEVRWLTCWAMSGVIQEAKLNELARILGVPVSLISNFSNPLPWGGKRGKLNGINWDEHEEGREWAWVEDGLPPREIDELKRLGCDDRYYYTYTSEHPEHLEATWNKLRQRWGN